MKDIAIFYDNYIYLSVSTPFKEKRNQKKQKINDQTFGTSVDDPAMDEEFDFEKNLALFDKKAIWNEINGFKKPDFLKNSQSMSYDKKYRHDENIISSQPTKFRQIKCLNRRAKQEYLTDMDLAIPTISESHRNDIYKTAEKNGLDLIRVCDVIARSATEMAIQLIGARRLIPKNQHQWPKIAIICDQQPVDRYSNLGFGTARYLSSHGLETFVYTHPFITNQLKTAFSINHKKCFEFQLYESSKRSFTSKLSELPTPDLIILSSASSHLDLNVTNWINSNRSPILAIDPPITGFNNISIKCSVIPILPLEDLSDKCGTLYLANLGFPEFFFSENLIQYKSPFGHKSVIPIHKSE